MFKIAMHNDANKPVGGSRGRHKQLSSYMCVFFFSVSFKQLITTVS